MDIHRPDTDIHREVWISVSENPIEIVDIPVDIHSDLMDILRLRMDIP